MNTELKLIVINNEIPKHTLYIVHAGAICRSFDDEKEAQLHAEILKRLCQYPVTIREVLC